MYSRSETLPEAFRTCGGGSRTPGWRAAFLPLKKEPKMPSCFWSRLYVGAACPPAFLSAAEPGPVGVAGFSCSLSVTLARARCPPMKLGWAVLM